jgi:hypothetical protein
VSAVLGIIVLLEVQTDDLNGGVVLSAELVVSRQIDFSVEVEVTVGAAGDLVALG